MPEQEKTVSSICYIQLNSFPDGVDCLVIQGKFREGNGGVQEENCGMNPVLPCPDYFTLSHDR